MEEIVPAINPIIKIIKCNSDKYWYSGKIGEQFYLFDSNVSDYYIKDEKGRVMAILKLDAEISF